MTYFHVQRTDFRIVEVPVRIYLKLVRTAPLCIEKVDFLERSEPFDDEILRLTGRKLECERDFVSGSRDRDGRYRPEPASAPNCDASDIWCG